MSDFLISNLTSKLSLDEKEVERQIERLVARLIDDIKRDGGSDIPEFGQFRFEDDGLKFTSATTLSEFVNFRYRSLQTFSFPAKDVADAKPSSPVESSAESPQEDSVGDDDSYLLEALLPKESLPASASAIPVPAPKTDRPPLKPRPSTGAERSERGKSKRTSESAIERDTKDEPRSRILRRALWFVPVLVLAAIMVLVIKPGEGELDLSEQANAPNELPLTEVGDLDAGEPDDDRTGAAVTDRESPSEDESTSIPKAGAASDRVDRPAPIKQDPAGGQPATSSQFVSDFARSAPGYTLIVGSVFTRASAEIEMRRFSNLSLPLAILDYGDGGVTRYRLAVGKFDTIEAAQLAMQSASGQLPNGTWVRRIR
ncbi:MAG: SPOR domain-containing protein [Bacteroidetes bacterium]|nr:SPOR domain-containing protein [Bacteroidota bacterium]